MIIFKHIFKFLDITNIFISKIMMFNYSIRYDDANKVLIYFPMLRHGKNTDLRLLESCEKGAFSVTKPVNITAIRVFLHIRLSLSPQLYMLCTSRSKVPRGSRPPFDPRF